MVNSYFEYTFSKCRFSSISSVCAVEKTKNDLIIKSSKKFNGCNSITSDCHFFNSIANCFYDYNIINPDFLGKDATIIYQRCSNVFLSKKKISYEIIFENANDLNWLLSSIHHARKSKHIDLLSKHSTLKEATRENLFDLYNSAIRENNECRYIEEALEARGKCLTGLYDFQYEESRHYLSREYDYQHLRDMLADFTNNSIYKMSLFYGLTATAALAEEIRRNS